MPTKPLTLLQHARAGATLVVHHPINTIRVTYDPKRRWMVEGVEQRFSSVVALLDSNTVTVQPAPTTFIQCPYRVVITYLQPGQEPELLAIFGCTTEEDAYRDAHQWKEATATAPGIQVRAIRAEDALFPEPQPVEATSVAPLPLSDLRSLPVWSSTERQHIVHQIAALDARAQTKKAN